MAIPTHPAKPYPTFTHAGNGVWHTLCEYCGVRLTASDIGSLSSTHALHVTREHGRDPE